MFSEVTSSRDRRKWSMTTPPFATTCRLAYIVFVVENATLVIGYSLGQVLRIVGFGKRIFDGYFFLAR